MNSDTYIPQTKQLKNVIRSFWQIDDPVPGKNETIIPKGVVEVIFDLSESRLAHSNIDNKQYQLAKCFINGFNTRPVQLQLPEKHFFFGVQFHPAAVKHLFGVPAGEFANLPVDLTLLDTTFHYLWEQLAEVKTFTERVMIITAWIEHKIIEEHPQEMLLDSFLENNDLNSIAIPELAKTVCYSTRHLSRKIYELTGMNTEQFLLYKKYLQAVHMTHYTDLALTAIAYHCNFSDQSHFIRSFRSFAQITPKQYRQNKSYVPGHMLKDVR